MPAVRKWYPGVTPINLVQDKCNCLNHDTVPLGWDGAVRCSGVRAAWWIQFRSSGVGTRFSCVRFVRVQCQLRTFIAIVLFLLEVLDYLKEQGVFVKFRGQGKRNPKASGSLSDFYIIENIHAVGKKKIVKFVTRSPKWRNGVGTRGRGVESEQSERLGVEVILFSCRNVSLSLEEMRKRRSVVCEPVHYSARSCHSIWPRSSRAEAPQAPVLEGGAHVLPPGGHADGDQQQLQEVAGAPCRADPEEGWRHALLEY